MGALAAGLAAAFARRAGSLSTGGQWAAFLTGTLAAAAGWRWAALLVAYFVTSTALTQLGHERKVTLTESVLPTQRERNALQVMTNGGLFAVAVLFGELLGNPHLFVAGLGALSAAAADTWATELGTLWGGAPFSIVNGRTLARGVSGGVTAVGVMASVLASLLMAAASSFVMAPTLDSGVIVAAAVFGAGLAGSIGDSLLGATLQSKRWCEQCRMWTERRVHTCQYRTQHARGLRWMTNDTVNFLATVLGALVALALAGPLRLR